MKKRTYKKVSKKLKLYVPFVPHSWKKFAVIKILNKLAALLNYLYKSNLLKNSTKSYKRRNCRGKLSRKIIFLNFIFFKIRINFFTLFDKSRVTCMRGFTKLYTNALIHKKSKPPRFLNFINNLFYLEKGLNLKDKQSGLFSEYIKYLWVSKKWFINHYGQLKILKSFKFNSNLRKFFETKKFLVGRRRHDLLHAARKNAFNRNNFFVPEVLFYKMLSGHLTKNGDKLGSVNRINLMKRLLTLNFGLNFNKNVKDLLVSMRIYRDYSLQTGRRLKPKVFKNNFQEFKKIIFYFFKSMWEKKTTLPLNSLFRITAEFSLILIGKNFRRRGIAEKSQYYIWKKHILQKPTPNKTKFKYKRLKLGKRGKRKVIKNRKQFRFPLVAILKKILKKKNFKKKKLKKKFKPCVRPGKVFL